MDPRAIPTTTGGSCAKPPSAGAWSSRCSPSATAAAAAVMCPRLLLAGSKALKSGPRSWQGLPTALSMEGLGQLWRSEGEDLGALPTPTGCTPLPSTPTSPPAHQPTSPCRWPPMQLFVHLAATLLLMTGRRLGSSSLILGDFEEFLFPGNASPRPAAHSWAG